MVVVGLQRELAAVAMAVAELVLGSEVQVRREGGVGGGKGEWRSGSTCWTAAGQAAPFSALYFTKVWHHPSTHPADPLHNLHCTKVWYHLSHPHPAVPV